jgi:hypothetical protein
METLLNSKFRLIELFNSNYSFSLFKKMFEFCLETKQIIHLKDYQPFFSNEEMKEIHLLNSKMFQGKESFQSLINYLSFDPSNETLKIEALSLGIKTSNIFSFDSISELKDKEWNTILNSLKEKKYQPVHHSTLKNEIESKLRLLHLSSYSGAVSYSSIKKDLELTNNDQVEDIILLGVSYQLLNNVKMDQEEEMIHFIPSNKKKDWKGLSGEMDHLTKILESI